MHAEEVTRQHLQGAGKKLTVAGSLEARNAWSACLSLCLLACMGRTCLHLMCMNDRSDDTQSVSSSLQCPALAYQTGGAITEACPWQRSSIDRHWQQVSLFVTSKGLMHSHNSHMLSSWNGSKWL